MVDVETEVRHDFLPIGDVLGAMRLSVTEAALVTGVDNMDTHGSMAAKCGANLAKEDPYGLDGNEAGALYLYTIQSLLYPEMNRLLRLRDRGQLMAFFPLLRLMMQARTKLPPFVGNVWRGIDRNLKGKFARGDTFYWWGFTSTTTKMSVTEGFLRGAGRTLFNINCVAGRDITRYSCFRDAEEEVLLFPGTHLRVVSVLDLSEDALLVQLEEVPAVGELLK